jgi:hypothetical protein
MTERDFDRKYQLTLREIANRCRKDVKLVPEECIPEPACGNAVDQCESPATSAQIGRTVLWVSDLRGRGLF